MSSETVSIIVPVYNVQKYLKICVESLLNQTFKDIEILLIDDGSTDDSLQICKEYKRRDKRIRVFHKENEGLGPTRNFGIKHATGKYVLFVDSDDWLREDSVQLLYTEAEHTNADVVYFDFVLYMQDQDQYVRCHENEGYLGCDTFVKTKLRNCMLPSACTSMYSLKMWREKELRFPATVFEDNAVYPLILLEFKKFAILPEGLYYYRKNCDTTITSNYANNLLRSQPLEYLISEIKKRGYYDTYKIDVLKFCYNQLRESLNQIKYYYNETIYVNEMYKFNTFFKKYFNCTDQFYDKNFMYMGSYNIGRVGNNISSQNINECRFNFFSLISLMTDKYEKYDLNCGNEYKELMFKKECNKDLLKILKKKPYKYLVFDLLEERYPLIRTTRGSYYTGTDSIVEFLKESKTKGYSIIENGSLEYVELWKECCLRFINYCKKNYDTTHLIMIRTLLADKYGNEKGLVQYKNKEYIQKTNKKLTEYYDYFAAQCPEVIDITPQKEDYYTDINFKYGCVPEHLNNQIYKELADIIVCKIESNFKVIGP